MRTTRSKPSQTTKATQGPGVPHGQIPPAQRPQTNSSEKRRSTSNQTEKKMRSYDSEAFQLENDNLHREMTELEESIQIKGAEIDVSQQVDATSISPNDRSDLPLSEEIASTLDNPPPAPSPPSSVTDVALCNVVEGEALDNLTPFANGHAVLLNSPGLDCHSESSRGLNGESKASAFENRWIITEIQHPVSHTVVSNFRGEATVVQIVDADTLKDVTTLDADRHAEHHVVSPMVVDAEPPGLPKVIDVFPEAIDTRQLEKAPPVDLRHLSLDEILAALNQDSLNFSYSFTCPAPSDPMSDQLTIVSCSLGGSTTINTTLASGSDSTFLPEPMMENRESSWRDGPVFATTKAMLKFGKKRPTSPYTEAALTKPSLKRLGASMLMEEDAKHTSLGCTSTEKVTGSYEANHAYFSFPTFSKDLKADIKSGLSLDITTAWNATAGAIVSDQSRLQQGLNEGMASRRYIWTRENEFAPIIIDAEPNFQPTISSSSSYSTEVVVYEGDTAMRSCGFANATYLLLEEILLLLGQFDTNFEYSFDRFSTNYRARYLLEFTAPADPETRADTYSDRPVHRWDRHYVNTCQKVVLWNPDRLRFIWTASAGNTSTTPLGSGDAPVNSEDPEETRRDGHEEFFSLHSHLLDDITGNEGISTMDPETSRFIWFPNAEISRPPILMHYFAVADEITTPDDDGDETTPPYRAPLLLGFGDWVHPDYRGTTSGLRLLLTPSKAPLMLEYEDLDFDGLFEDIEEESEGPAGDSAFSLRRSQERMAQTTSETATSFGAGLLKRIPIGPTVESDSDSEENDVSSEHAKWSPGQPLLGPMLSESENELAIAQGKRILPIAQKKDTNGRAAKVPSNQEVCGRNT